MALLLSSERPVLAAPTFSPFRALLAWLGKARMGRSQRLALADLLDLDCHRLDDLGIDRQALHEAMRHAPASPTRYLEERRKKASGQGA